jgi:hypothetical protein
MTLAVLLKTSQQLFSRKKAGRETVGFTGTIMGSAAASAGRASPRLPQRHFLSVFSRLAWRDGLSAD